MEGDVESIGQNHIWADIAQQMVDEMLSCNIDQFLGYYAPFIPSKDSVDSALAGLKYTSLLQDDGWQGLHSKSIPSKTIVFSKLTVIKLKDN